MATLSCSCTRRSRRRCEVRASAPNWCVERSTTCGPPADPMFRKAGTSRSSLTSTPGTPTWSGPASERPTPRRGRAAGRTVARPGGGGRGGRGGPEGRSVRPGWFTRHVGNPAVALLTRAGISVWGSRELRVRGRKSGEWRTTPVNLLTYEGARYLVAPRGVTQWVRNLREAGEGELRVGRRTEPFRATELEDEQKPPILRAYLRRWKAEVGIFFGGVGPDSSADDLLRISPDHPIFRIEALPT